MLEGDWIYPDPWGGSLSFDAATFKADSVRLVGPGYSGSVWHQYEIHEGLLLRDDETYRLRFNGDTLLATPVDDPERGTRLLPLRSTPEAPIPDRISVSTGWCLGSCPRWDVSFERGGQIWRREHTEEGSLTVGKAEAPEVVDRLRTLAAALRADTLHYADMLFDDQEIAIVVQYKDSAHVHVGTAHGIGRLGLLFWNAWDAVDTLTFQPTSDPYDFESRRALEDKRSMN